jgi:hypothetical protein
MTISFRNCLKKGKGKGKGKGIGKGEGEGEGKGKGKGKGEGEGGGRLGWGGSCVGTVGQSYGAYGGHK